MSCNATTWVLWKAELRSATASVSRTSVLSAWAVAPAVIS